MRGVGSSAHPIQQSSPGPPGQQHERIGTVAPEHEQVEVAEPALQRREAAAGFAGFALSNRRRLVPAEDVEIDVVTGAAEAGGAAQRIAFGMNTKGAASLDELAFAAVAFVAGATATLLWLGNFTRRIEFLRSQSF